MAMQESRKLFWVLPGGSSMFRRFGMCVVAATAAVSVTVPLADAAPIATEGQPCAEEAAAALTPSGSRLFCYFNFNPGAPAGLSWLRSALPYNNNVANDSAATALPGIGKSPTNFWPVAFFTTEIDLQRWGVASTIAWLKPEAFRGYFTSLAFTPNATNFLTGFQSWVNVLELNPGFGVGQQGGLKLLNDTFNDEGNRPAGLLGTVPANYVVLDNGLHVVILVIGTHMLQVEGPNEERTLNVVNQILAYSGRPGVSSLVPTKA
jgi:hypothetical protein